MSCGLKSSIATSYFVFRFCFVRWMQYAWVERDNVVGHFRVASSDYLFRLDNQKTMQRR